MLTVTSHLWEENKGGKLIFDRHPEIAIVRLPNRTPEIDASSAGIQSNITNGNGNHCKKCSARTDKHPRHIHVKHITLHWNFWWGCAARISKSRPNFRPKNAISHTRATHTQTWPQKSIPVPRDERGGHSGKSLQLTGSPPVRR